MTQGDALDHAMVASRTVAATRLSRPIALPLRALAALATVAVSFVVLSLAAPQRAAACQSTTCGVRNRPAECVRDPLTTCWTSGLPVRWASPCVSFSLAFQGVPRLGLDYAGAEALVGSAFALWTGATCANGPPSIFAAPLGPVSCEDVEFNPKGPNANVIAFRSADWPYDSDVIGLTSVTFAIATGEIRDADMELNLTHPEATREAMPYIIAHEAGHFLGLDHSADPTALMFSRYSPLASSAPTLATDDAATLCAAYDALRPVSECSFAPATGFAPECGGDVQGGCALSRQSSGHSSAALWLLSAALAFRRWRRAGRTAT